MRKAFAASSKDSADLASGFGYLLDKGIRIMGAGIIVLTGTLKALGLTFAGVALAREQFNSFKPSAAWATLKDMNAQVDASMDATHAAALAMLGYGKAQEQAAEAAKGVAV